LRRPPPVGADAMRYIGNKTRLLPFILGAIRKLGIESGTAHDAFAGTAAVGRALKGAGWRVASSDLMSYSEVFQQAYVVATSIPSFRELARHEPSVRRAVKDAQPDPELPPAVTALRAVGEWLTSGIPDERGFVTEHFSPAGGRMYFSEENASRIDAARRALHEWRGSGWIDEAAYFILLAALIEGADRVANTAGVYAAYIKSWQPNARRPLAIVPEIPTAGPRGATAHLADATDLASRLGTIDLLYIDPPYNARQYSGYYHIPEVIARGWFDERLTLRGKTGLLDSNGQRSAWCSPRRVRNALVELLAATGARHVLVSYNSEGLLPDADLRAVLEEASVDGKVRRVSKTYRRYRADADSETRRYKAGEVKELLYYARLR
jgi:adenine-specific DNA-methyltransferase